MRSVKIALAAVGTALVVIVAFAVLLAVFSGSSFTRGANVAVVKIDGIITDPAPVTRQLHEVG